MHFYKPMLAKPISKPFSGKDWIFEIKWDGFRAIAYVKDDFFSLQSRNGKELKHNFPELQELTKLSKNVVVDGEIVVMREGKVDFHALQERGHLISKSDIEELANQQPATFVIFDILEKNDKPLVGLSLIERKAILKESVKEGSHIIINEFTEESGERFYRAVLKHDLEGMVAKKEDSLYEQGLRTGSWLKIKNLKTVDCVIFGYSRGEGARASTFGALVVGLYDDGKPLYIAHVGTGFSYVKLTQLYIDFQGMKTDFAPFRVPGFENVTWLQPKLVCEVVYQVVTRDCRLRMPRFQRLREDKEPNDCTIDQIEGEGKCASRHIVLKDSIKNSSGRAWGS
jgi:bifunctional non-homologous end joining protein LigD